MQGRQFPDANLPAAAPEERKAIFEIAIKTLARFQTIDTDKLNLDCIGDKENFFQQRVGNIITFIHATEAAKLEYLSQLTFKWFKIVTTWSVIIRLRAGFPTQSLAFICVI